jgi:para-aminobenzoate synthetase component 1
VCPALNTTIQTNCLFPVADFKQLKEKVLNWASQFSTFCFLDNHQYRISPHTNECLLAAGVKRKIKCSAGTALTQLQQFIEDCNEKAKAPTWLFGHLGYDLKNETEKLFSANDDYIGFPDLFFFEPEVMIRFDEKAMDITGDLPAKIFEEVMQQDTGIVKQQTSIKINARFAADEYISTVNKLKQHIRRGDCYEINFCQELYATGAYIDPLSVYQHLSTVSPNPFSALYRINDQWLICASPERFLRKEGNSILTQPIKGTSKRITENEAEDEIRKQALKHSAKDRSENVMVVDLVRNDLSKVCKEGSVKVDELYGIYSFPQVHQMISTVSGDLKDDISFAEIIRATFPMGSMTGAPKKKVMELIETYEKTKRGIFSGAVGYITPGGDFDFNVVIRSIMYNALTGYISFQAGSGITWYSDAEKECEECLMKAEAMRGVLAAQGPVNK